MLQGDFMNDDDEDDFKSSDGKKEPIGKKPAAAAKKPAAKKPKAAAKPAPAKQQKNSPPRASKPKAAPKPAPDAAPNTTVAPRKANPAGASSSVAAASKTSPPPKAAASTKAKAATAPAKAAPKKTIGSVEERIADYMITQNRPFNATMITDNLHKDIPKSQVEKALEGLAVKGTLICKEVGKQKIFFPNQSQFEVPTPAELDRMTNQAKNKGEEVQALRSSNNSGEQQLKALEAEPTDSELPLQIRALEEEVRQMQARASVIEGSGQAIGPGEKEKIMKDYCKMRKEWKSRKRQVTEGIEQMCEAMDTMRPKQLIEKMGIETDEEWKMVLGEDKTEAKKVPLANAGQKRKFNAR